MEVIFYYVYCLWMKRNKKKKQYNFIIINNFKKIIIINYINLKQNFQKLFDVLYGKPTDEQRTDNQ